MFIHSRYISSVLLQVLKWAYRMYLACMCTVYAKLDNAGLIRDQWYRIGPDNGITDVGLMQLTSGGQNADDGLTFPRHSGIPVFTYDLSTSQNKLNNTRSRIWTCTVCFCPVSTISCLDVKGVFTPPALRVAITITITCS